VDRAGRRRDRDGIGGDAAETRFAIVGYPCFSYHEALIPFHEKFNVTMRTIHVAIYNPGHPFPRIGYLICFVLLGMAFHIQTVMANPIRDPDVPLTFHLMDDGAPVRSPVELVYTCGKSSTPVFSVRCTTECVVVMPHSYMYGSCNLSVAPEGREAFTIGGFAVTDFYFYADQSTYNATIDIRNRSCSYTPNFLDKSFSVSGCKKEKTVDAVMGEFYGYPWIYLLAWIMTVGIEWIVALMLVRSIFKIPQLSFPKTFLSVAAANLITLPMAWLTMIALGRFVTANYIVDISIAEFLAVVVEAVLYRKFLALKTGHAILLSIAANSASYLIGAILFGF
jgi:hypothetical protein